MSLASGSNTSLVNLEGGDLLDQGIPSTLLAHADEAFERRFFCCAAGARSWSFCADLTFT
jgi:hypothetical protein